LDYRWVKVSIIIALVVIAPTVAVFAADPLAFYRIQVPPGCVGVLFEENLLNTLPPDVSKALVQISIDSPIGGLGKKYAAAPRGGRSFHVVCIEAEGGLRGAEERFQDAVNRMKSAMGSAGGDLPVFIFPTVNIVLTAFSGDRKYVASIQYSAVDLYKEKGFLEPEAVKRAMQDPFAPFRGSHVIVVKSRSTGFYLVNSTKVLEAVQRDLENRGVHVRAPWEPPRPEDIVEANLTPRRLTGVIPTVEAQSSCPTTFFAVWNYDLDNSKYNPPQEWYNRVVPSSYTAYAWYSFASRLSTEFWCRTDLCKSSTDAALTVQQYYYPGLSSVSEYLSKVTSLYLNWVNTYQALTVVATVDVPIGIVYYNPNYKYVEPMLSVSVSSYKRIVRGWAVLGILIHGISVTTNDDKTIPLARPDSGTVFLFIPTYLNYLYDAIIVDIYTYRGYYGGCSYWVARPLFTFIPHYAAQPDFRNMYVRISPVDTYEWPWQIYDLTWSGVTATVFQNTWWNPISAGTFMYIETSSMLLTCGDPSQMAAIVTSIFKTLFDTIISSILGGISKVASMAYGVGSSLITYVDMTYNITFYAYNLTIASRNSVPPPTTLTVSKYTAQLLAENFTLCDVKPAMLIWYIEVR